MEDLKAQVAANKNILDLGCCTFRLDKLPKKGSTLMSGEKFMVASRAIPERESDRDGLSAGCRNQTHHTTMKRKRLVLTTFVGC